MRLTFKISILQIRVGQLMKEIEQQKMQNQTFENDNPLLQEASKLIEELNLIKKENEQLQQHKANNEIHHDDDE